MTRTRTRVAAAFALTSLLAACGGTAAPSAVEAPSTGVAVDATAPATTATALPSPTMAMSPSPTPTPGPTGYAAVEEALDAAGVLMTDGAAATNITPDLFAEMWNLRALATSTSGFGWKFDTLPKPKLDAAGHPVIGVTLSKGLAADAVMVLNDDGSLRAVAVMTPSGGYGGLLPYLSVNMVYGLLAETLRPGENLGPVGALGLADAAAPRAGMDVTTDMGGLRFRFIGTADHGDWLVATPAP